VERGRFYQQFGERSGSGQQEKLPALPLGEKPLSGERKRAPIAIEARLAEMDSMWGIPREIGKTVNDAANIMDDRLNALHQEVLAVGDQASIYTMNVVNFTFKYYHFNFLTHDKRVALYEALEAWREQYPQAKAYVMTERERRIVSDCSERMGNGAWYPFEIDPTGESVEPFPRLADLWDYDFPDAE